MVERDGPVRRHLGRRRRAQHPVPGGADRAVGPPGLPRRDVPAPARRDARPRRAHRRADGPGPLARQRPGVVRATVLDHGPHLGRHPHRHAAVCRAGLAPRCLARAAGPGVERRRRRHGRRPPRRSRRAGPPAGDVPRRRRHAGRAPRRPRALPHVGRGRRTAPAVPPGAARAAGRPTARARRGAVPGVGRRPPQQPDLPGLRGGGGARLGDVGHRRPPARPRLVAVRRRGAHDRFPMHAPAGLPRARGDRVGAGRPPRAGRPTRWRTTSCSPACASR